MKQRKVLIAIAVVIFILLLLKSFFRMEYLANLFVFWKEVIIFVSD